MERKDFLNPAGIYRPAPFWSWNDDLRNEELEAQALDMKKRGWGGYFMHSRIGLVTPYLSDEWMDRTRHTVELSAREELCAYLYDEDKWPSGYAGGLVPRSNPAVR
ncbi:MAG TPA: glycoside hydrolase, partial [Candidatus Latescibacteria bacterium]|nr:glycoside hydrolase [Candidatus Latescibacterota bacterium]